MIVGVRKRGLKNMTDWHVYPKEKPPEKTRYLITVNFGDKKDYTDDTAYDPATDEFLGYENRDWVRAWADYPRAYREDDAGEWNVYPNILPEKNTVCFITYEDTYSGDRFVSKNVFYESFTIECLNRYRILAWMNIPQPYHE